MNQNYKNFENIAKEACLIGAKVLKKYFDELELNDFELKDGAGIVTKADKESELVIVNYLKEKTPDFGILAEEGGLQDKGASKWIIDPLDGTTNFFHGFPHFNISIGLEIDGVVVVAVVHNPITEDTFHCHKGSGAYRNEKPIHVSNRKDLSSSLLGTGFAYMRGDVLDQALDLFREFTNKCHGIRRPGAAALDLCYTACGIYDGFYEKTLSPWDVAAGSLLISEAGGSLSSFDGSKFSIYSKSIVASNGFIHEEIMKVIKDNAKS